MRTALPKALASEREFRRRKSKNRLWAGPYIIWMLLFTVIPLVLMLYYAFTDKSGSLTFSNIATAVGYIGTLLKSIAFAAVSTVICLIAAFPFAYFLSRRGYSAQKTMIMLVMLPMWMNFLLRTYAWMILLEDTGVINGILAAIGLGPAKLINTSGAVIVGMVYNYIPFMILPLYSIMTKIDDNTVNAARDLGANPLKVLIKVLLPLSMPGVISGVTMVFVPAVSTFVISNLLGGSDNFLIGDLIEQQFMGNALNYNCGSASAMLLMVVVLISMILFNRFKDEDSEELLV